MSNSSKVPHGLLSVKFFAQQTEKRLIVKRVGWLKNEDLQMCISTQFLALISNSTYELVESWEWKDVVGIQPSLTNIEEFILVINGSKQHLLSNERSELLCILLDYKSRTTTKHSDRPQFNTQRITENSKEKSTILEIHPYGICEKTPHHVHVTYFPQIKTLCISNSIQIVTAMRTVTHKLPKNEADRVAAEIVNRAKLIGIKIPVRDDLLPSTLPRVDSDNALIEIRVKRGSAEKIICLGEKFFVERTAGNYAASFARRLNTIVSVTRARDAMQVIVTFDDETTRSYTTSHRETLIASLYDASQLANGDVSVSDIPRFTSLVITKMTPKESATTEAILLKNIAAFDSANCVNIDPTEVMMIWIFLLNSNCPPNGPRFAEANKSKNIELALSKILKFGKPGEMFLQALHRLLATENGYKAFVEKKNIQEGVIEVIGMALQSVKGIVVFWALKVVGKLLSPGVDDEVEKQGKLAVMTQGIPERIFATLVGALKQNDTLVVHGCVNVIRYIVCEPYSNTTEYSMFNRMMQILAGLGRDVFSLFQSPCISIPHIAGQLVQALVEETDLQERITELQDYALLDGITLQYLHTICFDQPKTTNQVLHKLLAFQLVDLFTAGHEQCNLLLQRIFPVALLDYLYSDEQPPEDLSVPIEQTKTKSSLQTTTSTNSLSASITAATTLFKKWNSPQQHVVIRTRTKRQLHQHRNWRMFAYQLHQQHRRAELIWNHQTAIELREALELELRLLRKAQEDQTVAWNYREFIVDYHCLHEEVCVDGCYVRCLLESKEFTIKNPKDFFDILYHRCLFESNRELQALAIQTMAVVYSKYYNEIGPVKDIIHLFAMLKSTKSLLLRDRLLQLLSALLRVEPNAQRFIDVGGIQYYVNLLTLAHLHVDHTILPTQTKLIANGSSDNEWYYILVDPTTKQKEKKGPISLTALQELFNTGVVPQTLVWAQGMEDWCQIQDIPLLKWTFLKEDTSILPPMELICLLLDTLHQLIVMYPSRDKNNVLLHPIPRAKRVLSSPRTLPIVVQLLLTASPRLVDTTAKLLNNLLIDNPSTKHKFYLTGAFYFALSYAGSNFKALSALLHSSHLTQKSDEFDTIHSVLRPLLPSALISVLDRDSDEFAARFVGEVSLPSLRWSSTMRQELLDALSQHLGDFPRRLQANPLAVYSHVPIAPITYEELKGELYCGSVYLSQFCEDPNFIVNDPVGLLQSILHTWSEIYDARPSMSTTDACNILGVSVGADNNTLRRAYYKLAAKYHPDKNPDGREMFESINNAYNLLIDAEQADVTSKHIILLRSQHVLYDQYSEALQPYKYAAYPLLIPFLNDTELRSDALTLLYFTLRSSTLNVQEFSRLGGLQPLFQLLDELIAPSNLSKNSDSSTSQPSLGSSNNSSISQIRAILRAISVAATFDAPREIIKKNTTILHNIKRCLRSDLLLVVEASLDAICRLCGDKQLQNELFDMNIASDLLLRIFAYDSTLEDVDTESIHQQTNALSAMALLALKELIPLNEPTEHLKILCSLLTPQLTIQIRNSSVTDSLRILTTSTCTPYILWTAPMRQQLLDYLDAHLSGTDDWQPSDALSFKFTALENELIVNGIYLRIFNEQIRTSEPLQQPVEFVNELIKRSQQIQEYLMSFDSQFLQSPTPEVQKELSSLRCIALAIHNIVEHYNISNEFCSSPFLEEFLHLLQEIPFDNSVQNDLLQTLSYLLKTPSCVDSIASSKSCGHLMLLLYSTSHLQQLLSIIQTLFTIPSAITQAILRGGLLYLLHHLLTSDDIDLKTNISSTIAKMLSISVVGPKVYTTLIKFLPSAIVNTLRHDPRGAVVLLDTTQESPELIWNPEMKESLLTFIDSMTTAFHSKQQTDSTVKWVVPDSFSFKYESLSDVLNIGGVYLSIFNKNPTCPLDHPNNFTDALFDSYASAYRSNDETTTSLISTSIALFYTNQPLQLQYVASSGHLSKLIEFLDTPDITLFTILHAVATSSTCRDKLLSDGIVSLLLPCITKFPTSAKTIADLLRVLTADHSCAGVLCYVPTLSTPESLNPIFEVLSGTLDDSIGSDAAEVKALLVDSLQSAINDASHGAQLESVLSQNPIWEQYSSQKHALYLSNASALSGYIAAPSAASTSVGLITAAEDATVQRPDLPPDFD